jgi:hypothetical protein
MATLLDGAVKRRVEVRVRQLRPDSVRQWGRMTPHQAICHLNDSFKLALNERPAAPIDWPLRAVIRFIALDVPLQWAKGRIKTAPEAEQGGGGTPPVEFELDRGELLALMERFCSAGDDQYCPTHPIFGRMSARHWRRWAYLHMDHHLRQFGL